MKKNEVKISVTLGNIADSTPDDAWSMICEKYGINEWCLNEGLADRNDTIEITLEDAEKIGIIEKDE